jgi:hypothetical protein
LARGAGAARNRPRSLRSDRHRNSDAAAAACADAAIDQAHPAVEELLAGWRLPPSKDSPAIPLQGRFFPLFARKNSAVRSVAESGS